MRGSEFVGAPITYEGVVNMSANDIHIFQENASSDYVDRVISYIATGQVLIINGSNLPSFRALLIGDISSLQAALDAKIASTLIGAANGIAPLGSDSKISSSYLPTSIAGGYNPQGAWDASTNTPTLPAASTSNKGWMYKVSVAGSTAVDGWTEWKQNDILISNGTTWDKFDNTDQVSSVAGRQGAVVLTSTDVGLGNVVNALQFLASNVDIDNTLAANSDAKVASQKAIKAYIATYSAPIAHNHDANYEAKNANIQTHIADTVAHVTASDKTNWNAKHSWSSVPASATSTGTAGQLAYDDDYCYICVAANKWKRFILTTW
jgi:hypothetical protein